MLPQDLSPGLYDHPLSAAVHQALASQPVSLHHIHPLDPAEAPQRLARYLHQLSEIALADGTLLINAPSEPSVGMALQAECPSADRIDPRQRPLRVQRRSTAPA
jgi:hypothetical protein